MSRDYQAEHRARADDLGLRQTSIGSCPRRLAGKRHVLGECWCESRLNDHGRRYRRTRDDKPIVMWEPYDAYGRDLTEVISAAEADGLRVHISGASPWNPGGTFCIAFIPQSGGPDAA